MYRFLLLHGKSILFQMQMYTVAYENEYLHQHRFIEYIFHDILCNISYTSVKQSHKKASFWKP